MRNLLDVGVGADDVLYLVRVGVLEGEAAGPDQHPLPALHPEAIHYRQNLTLQLHHLVDGKPLISVSRTKANPVGTMGRSWETQAAAQ